MDDILIIGSNIPMLNEVKHYLGTCFAMKDLGEAAYILGMKIYRDGSKWLLGLSQTMYIDKNVDTLQDGKLQERRCSYD